MRSRALCVAFVAALSLGPSCGAPDTRSDVPYDARFGSATTMDVFLPDDDGRAHAGILMVHGGGWTIGDKNNYWWDAQRFARSGWVAASINYRLGSDGVFPRAPQDVACALAFLRLHAADYRLDPDRIAVTGYSAGGHLAALVALATDDPGIAPDCAAIAAAGPPAPPRAVVTAAGPMDLTLYGDSSGVVAFLGAKLEDAPDLWREASPISHVRPNAPPFLLVQGQADWLVSPDHAKHMRDALRAAGDDAELIEIVGDGHLLQSDPAASGQELQAIYDTPEAWTAVSDFLSRTLGPP